MAICSVVCQFSYSFPNLKLFKKAISCNAIIACFFTKGLKKFGAYFAQSFARNYVLGFHTNQHWNGNLNYTWLSDLWVLFINYLFSLKTSHPCRDLNPGPPQFQTDMLPTELSWLGCKQIISSKWYPNIVSIEFSPLGLINVSNGH